MQSAGICEIPSIGDCAGHGSCQNGACACEDGWWGLGCQSATECTGAAQLVSARGECCGVGASVDARGDCCESGVLDRRGACCASGSLDACGECGGMAAVVDARGGCCAGLLDAKGECCRGEDLDECGVCQGDGSSCGTTAEVTILMTRQFSEWNDVLQYAGKFLLERLSDFSITGEMLSIVNVDVLLPGQADDDGGSEPQVTVMASLSPSTIDVLGTSLPDAAELAGQTLELRIRFSVHAAPAERRQRGRGMPPRIPSVSELYRAFLRPGEQPAQRGDELQVLQVRRRRHCWLGV